MACIPLNEFYTTRQDHVYTVKSINLRKREGGGGGGGGGGKVAIAKCSPPLALPSGILYHVRKIEILRRMGARVLGCGISYIPR